MAADQSRTVEQIFRDFNGRRSGLIKALTTDFEDFHRECCPERENLCLYGLPSGQWEVKPPDEDIPSDLPEPPLGINFSRDGIEQNDWLTLIAVHSDSWLLAVAYYFGARYGLSKVDRNLLFGMINDLPTVFEVVIGAHNKQSTERSSVTYQSSSKSNSNSNLELQVELQSRYPKTEAIEEDVDKPGDTLCGACGEKYASDGFWICCDICESWLHGECVNITPAKAEHIETYKCPSCINKKARRRT